MVTKLESLGESWCDTTTDAGRLMLTIMGGIAEFERGLIRKRTDEGIERARKHHLEVAFNPKPVKRRKSK